MPDSTKRDGAIGKIYTAAGDTQVQAADTNFTAANANLTAANTPIHIIFDPGSGSGLQTGPKKMAAYPKENRVLAIGNKTQGVLA